MAIRDTIYNFGAKCQSFALQVHQNKPGPRTSSAAYYAARYCPCNVFFSEWTQGILKFTHENQVSARLLSVLHSVNRAGIPSPVEIVGNFGWLRGERGKTLYLGFSAWEKACELCGAPGSRLRSVTRQLLRGKRPTTSETFYCKTCRAADHV